MTPLIGTLQGLTNAVLAEWIAAAIAPMSILLLLAPTP
jgi:hypothetical protein